MLDGFDVKITQNGHVFTVSGDDASKLYEKLRSSQISYKGFKTGDFKDGVFTLEKMSMPTKMAVAT